MCSFVLKEKQKMIIAIDVGNTRIKVAVYDRNTWSGFYHVDTKNFRSQIENITDKLQEKPNIILSSVGKFNEYQLKWLAAKGQLHIVNAQDKLPFENKYGTPHTLGTDRIALAAGLALEFPEQNKLVIDCGTCFTYDFVNQQNQYFGGAISPGLNLRYKSLNDYTEKLPLLTINNSHPLVGASTEQSIQSGVINGAVAEIDGFINEYKSRFDNLTVILTGGDAIFLAESIKNNIFVRSNFLIESLILYYQYINS